MKSMNVPFEENKDRLIAEINGKTTGSQSIETGDVHFALTYFFTDRVFCDKQFEFSYYAACLLCWPSKLQSTKHYLYRNKNPFTSVTNEKVNKSMPGQ